MRTRSAVVSSAVLALACAGASLTGPGDVVGTTWRLQTLQRVRTVGVSPPAGEFFLRFGDDGRVEVRADCNGCAGTYSMSIGRLSVSPLACTLAFCPSAPFDTDYVRLAETATTVERDGEALILRSPDGMLRFVH